MIVKKLIKPISKYGLANVNLSEYAKLNDNNNGDFIIGDKNGYNILFAKPFNYNGSQFCSIKIRNGNTNYCIIETNYTTRTTNISGGSGNINIANVLTPTQNSQATNKQYVDNLVGNCAKLNDINQINQNTIYANDFKTRKSWLSSSGDSGYLSGENKLILKDLTSNNELVIGSDLKFQNVRIATQNDINDIMNNYPDYFYLERYYYTQEQVNELVNKQINLTENVEVAIPNYFINGKQVYKKYCTNDSQVIDTFANVDTLINFTGMVAKTNGTFRQVPWNYSGSECYFYDSSVATKLSTKGNATTGHKLIIEYTKIGE